MEKLKSEGGLILMKIIRKLALGTAIYGILEFGYRLGQGAMLGAMHYFGYSAEDAIQAFSEDDDLRFYS